MNPRSKKTGQPIVGIMETCPGTASIMGETFKKGDDGQLEFEYGGETDFEFSDQHAIKVDGIRQFMGEDGWSIPKTRSNWSRKRTRRTPLRCPQPALSPRKPETPAPEPHVSAQKTFSCAR